jgi:hypothetical protein
MVIHVNEQVKTQFESRAVNNGDLPTIFQNRRDNRTATSGANFLNVLDAAGAAAEAIIPQAGVIVETIKNSNNTVDKETLRLGFARTIRRTSDTIALYMPDTLVFRHNQQYAEAELGKSRLSLALAGGASIVDAIKNSPNDIKGMLASLGRNASPFINAIAGQFLEGKGVLAKTGFAAVTGTVLNPMLEMLFTSPEFRQFQFDFMLYARSEKEGQEIHRILDRLKYHQAPEFNTATNGFLMVPPSEFDIKFYYNGKENPNIPKISTCVLNSIDIDYAPNGFSAYEVPKENVPSRGGTGMPVAIRLTLNFKETEYLTKANYGKSSSSNPGELRTPAEIESSRSLSDFQG